MTAHAGTRRKFNLGPVYRIPAGEGRALRVEGLDIAVFRTRSGVIYATDAWCTHLGGPLADGIVGNGKVICPLHGYKFSLRSGAAEGHDCPALKTYPVTLDAEGDVVITLDAISLARARVSLVHYGERNAPLADAIVTGGAMLDELCVYEWRMPNDVSPLERLMDAVVGGDIDAVVFTSQVQVPHLLGGARRARNRTTPRIHPAETRSSRRPHRHPLRRSPASLNVIRCRTLSTGVSSGPPKQPGAGTHVVLRVFVALKEGIYDTRTSGSTSPGSIRRLRTRVRRPVR